MHAALVVMVGMSLGVDVGWQSLDDGGIEYIIQLEPQALELLRSGEELRSDIPPALRAQMRSYRIKVGSGELPRDLDLNPPTETGRGSAASRAGAASEASVPPASASQAVEQSASDRAASAGNVFPDETTSTRPPRNEPRYPADTPLEQRSMPAPRHVDPVAEQPPRMIEPDPETSALVNHESAYRDADHENHMAGPSADKKVAATKSSEAPAARWWPLTGAMLMLFVSMGGNAYLGMQWWSARQRCQQLLEQIRSPRSSSTSESAESIDDADEDQDVRIVNERRRR